MTTNLVTKRLCKKKTYNIIILQTERKTLNLKLDFGLWRINNNEKYRPTICEVS